MITSQLFQQRCSKFSCKKDVQKEITVKRKLEDENLHSKPTLGSQVGDVTLVSSVQQEISGAHGQNASGSELIGRCEWQEFCSTPIKVKRGVVGSTVHRETKTGRNSKSGCVRTRCVTDVGLQHVSVPPEYDHEQDIGRLVWAKFGRTGWWPGVIIPGPMAAMESTDDTTAWVFWFGDRKISQVQSRSIKAFQEFYSSCVKKFGTPVYHQALNEILQVCQERCGIDAQKDIGKTLKEWAEEKFPLPTKPNTNSVEEMLLPNNDKPLPRFVADRLKEIASTMTLRVTLQKSKDKTGAQKQTMSAHCRSGKSGQSKSSKSKLKGDAVKSHTCNNIECNLYNGQPLCQYDDHFKEYMGCNLKYPTEKKPIRVLSLFDGIATGKLVLNNLGIQVEVFYSCEIDDDATMVVTENHGKNVVQLGDVRQLTQEKLCELGGIDLLIGGSPCNDFSRANPDRKGFSIDGTGILFFDFYRVFMELRTLARDNGRRLFWLYENVASMSPSERNTLSRFLECDSAVWNAIFFTPQCRKRLFWGNIPNICRTPEERGLVPSVKLNSMLNDSRVAKYDYLRCVTSKRNSILMGPKENIMPVQVDGKDTGLTMDEIERIFGFPENYTDLESSKLGVTRRHKLIGRSWCVPVVEKILHPLTAYFKLKTSKTA
ncbi:hypothetical protein FSP39_022766 [Pinctada imbricata]|uniref:DNA (cytosine-5-)-methyltransferase n=1 Tax=Pinctada imbricata TaxID=66713 RepID=A0AA88YL64_PINIB|nr:hypothetical protein FSP39_022766 [Pinctada imbricata]